MSEMPRIEWNRLWGELGAHGNGTAVFYMLVRAYSGPRRHYHTLGHVMRVLDAIDEVIAGQDDGQSPRDALRWAAWFHDAVMFEGTDDEACSAELARETALRAHLGEAFATRVHELVIVTAHNEPVLGNAASILVDADLSILGAEPAVFDEYEAKVRLEWPDVSDVDFRSARAEVLEGFLARPRIYCTAFASSQWEKQAHANLESSIAKLRAVGTNG